MILNRISSQETKCYKTELEILKKKNKKNLMFSGKTVDTELSICKGNFIITLGNNRQ